MRVVTSRPRLDIYFREDRWGSVELADDKIVVDGPKDYAIRNVLRGLRREYTTDVNLFAALPMRLTGHVHAAQVA